MFTFVKRPSAAEQRQGAGMTPAVRRRPPLHQPPGYGVRTEITDTRTRPLEAPLRARFEARLGERLEDIRIHTGPNVDEAFRESGTLAATFGPDIALSSAVPSIASREGQRVLAHELIHACQQKGVADSGSTGVDQNAEQQAHDLATRVLEPGPPLRIQRATAKSVMCLTAQSGQQSAAAPAGIITADLTSPVVVGRAVRLQADVAPGAPYSAGPLQYFYPSYAWTVFDRSTNAVVAQTMTAENQATIAYPRPGQFRIECVLTDPRKGVAPAMKLEQDAVAENAALAGALSSDSDYAEAERELVDDFAGYVHDAAASTGPRGVTARFIAAILREEIANTAVWPTWVGPSNKEYRAREIGDVNAGLERRAAGGSVDMKDIDKSIGVGQMKLSTAAMMRGLIPWTEQDPQNKAPARASIKADFAGLSTSAMSGLRDLLAWPKSNIGMVANSLATLKNRTNRYPSLTRAAFGTNQRACEIVATEYNLGATNSSEAAASPSDYGTRIWSYMSLPLLQSFFRNA